MLDGGKRDIMKAIANKETSGAEQVPPHQEHLLVLAVCNDLS